MDNYNTKVETYIDKIKTYVDSATLKTLRDQHASGDNYQVSNAEHFHHEWGRGGHRELTTKFLTGDHQLLILSVCNYHWYTDSDDSADYADGKTTLTYLIKNDPVAVLIFNQIRAST